MIDQPDHDAEFSLQGEGLPLPDALRRRTRHVTFPPGAMVLRQGEPAGGLYLILSGRVQVLLHTGGEVRMLARLDQGAWLGETALLTGAVSSTTVVADTEVEALSITQGDFLAAADEDPSIFRTMAELLAQRLRSTDRLLNERTACRIVLLWHDRAHAALAAQILRECHRWTPGTFLALSNSDVAAGSAAREYLTSPGLFDRLERQVASGAPMIIPTGDPGRPELSSFLGRASSFASLIVVAVSQPISPIVMPRITETVSLERVAARSSVAASDLDVPHQTWKVGPAFDPGRVARAICRQRIGLALGGGAARGFAHVGVLKVLQEAGVPIDVLAGTSVGAPIAARIASGDPIDDIASGIESVGQAAMVPQLFPAHSLFTNTFMKAVLKRHIRQRQFDELLLPLGVTAVDLDTAEELVFSSGALIPALLASMAVPGIFPPVQYAGRVLVDGGVRMPVPISACRGLGADIVIASRLRVAPQARSDGFAMLPWLPDTFAQAMDIMQDQIGDALQTADLQIETAIPRRLAGMFDFRHRAFIEAAGEAAARAMLPRLIDRVPGLRRQAPAQRLAA